MGPALIHDLVSAVPLLPATGRKPGRPHAEPRDIVHAAILKTFEHRTGRGTVELMDRAVAAGYLAGRKPPHYNTLYEQMADPALMPIFQDLVFATARPFVDNARSFAIDSTGFTTSVFERWNNHKHGSKKAQQALKILNGNRKHQWVKAHFVVDTDSFAITACAMTNRRVGDVTMADSLIHDVIRSGCTIEKFTADAAYISTDVVELLENANAEAYITFRRNMNGRSSKALTRLHAKMTSEPESYLQEFHARSSVESAIGVLKKQWGGNVSARLPHAMYAELMTKVIAHNISRLVYAICAMDLDPTFWKPSSPVVVLPARVRPLIHMVVP